MDRSQRRRNGLGSCEAHHVGFSPQEDRGGTAGTVGEAEGWAEEDSVGRTLYGEAGGNAG
jgi:hypothetical protein